MLLSVIAKAWCCCLVALHVILLMLMFHVFWIFLCTFVLCALGFWPLGLFFLVLWVLGLDVPDLFMRFHFICFGFVHAFLFYMLWVSFYIRSWFFVIVYNCCVLALLLTGSSRYFLFHKCSLFSCFHLRLPWFATLHMVVLICRPLHFFLSINSKIWQYKTLTIIFSGWPWSQLPASWPYKHYVDCFISSD